jgi:hypothetical protein
MSEAATADFGMWVFIASEILFFGPLLLTYAYGRSQWPEGFAAASRHTDVLLGTLNTARAADQQLLRGHGRCRARGAQAGGGRRACSRPPRCSARLPVREGAGVPQGVA